MKVFFICFYFKRAFDKKLKEINDKKKETEIILHQNYSKFFKKYRINTALYAEVTFHGQAEIHAGACHPLA